MLYLDTETYNTDNIKKLGTYRYAETCELMIMSYAFDDGPVHIWDATQEPIPKGLRERLEGTEIIVAHNAMFDRNVLKHALGIETDIKRWRCSMVKALSLALPGGLDALGYAIGLDDDVKKLKDGKKLIQKFCKPAPRNHKVERHTRENSPEEWARFIEYARMDIEAMRHIWKLLPDWNYSGEELDLYHLDQVINDRGFAVDLELAHAALRATNRCQALLAEEIDQLTGGAVTKATQRDQLLEHIATEYDVKLDGLTKADVAAALDSDDIIHPVKRLLQIRRKASKTSSAKYAALIRTVSADGRLRGALQFAGASRTRRWAGRSFQVHNLPSRGIYKGQHVAQGILALKADCADICEDNLMKLISSCVRGVVVAAKGHKLIVSDLSNIEGRVNAWLADEKWKLEAFAAFDKGVGFDLYLLAYAKAYGIPPDKVTPEQRDVGKVMELAFGYQGAVGAYRKFSNDDVSDEDIVGRVRAWRQAHPAIVKLWHTMESAAKRAIKNPETSFSAGRVVFRKHNQWLLMKLPSKRVVCYYRAALDEQGCITYMGTDAEAGKYTWGPLTTYGGKLTENACQSVARDILAPGIRFAENSGYKNIFSVHDELVAEVPDTEEYNEAALSRILATNPPWASGLPLAASGFETKRYRKD